MYEWESVSLPKQWTVSIKLVAVPFGFKQLVLETCYFPTVSSLRPPSTIPHFGLRQWPDVEGRGRWTWWYLNLSSPSSESNLPPFPPWTKSPIFTASSLGRTRLKELLVCIYRFYLSYITAISPVAWISAWSAWGTHPSNKCSSTSTLYILPFLFFKWKKI